MRACFTIALLFTIGALHSSGQGYEWEGSPREPLTIPRTYIGLEARASFATHTASLRYIEQELGITCCTYDNGAGFPLALSVVGERWVSSHMKISAGAGVSVVGATFVAPTQPVPLSNGQMLRTEYVLDGSLTYASAFGSISMRLGSSHVLASVGARLHGYLSGSMTQRERIVAPDNVMFTGQEPGSEVVIAQTFLDAATPLIVEPFIQLSYDVPLSMGLVLQPSLHVGLPLMSLSTADDWRMMGYGVGLRLVKGL
jgi:hypothetical protein